MTLARVHTCGHTAPLDQPCPTCGPSPAARAENQRKANRVTYREVYATPRWKALRLRILERDKWRCQDCGAKANQAAHIHPFTNGNDPKAWDPRNLKASCPSCNSHEANQRKGDSDASPQPKPSRTPRHGRSRQEETAWVI